MKYVWSCRIEVDSEVELYAKEVDQVVRSWIYRLRDDPTTPVHVPRTWISKTDDEGGKYVGPEVKLTEEYVDVRRARKHEVEAVDF